MSTEFQLTIDCADPQAMVRFWAPALGYIPEPPPAGHESWRSYWQAAGVPEEELPEGAGDVPESIIDPEGKKPRIWFQQVPEGKRVKNRWHFDLKVSGGSQVPLAERKKLIGQAVEGYAAAGAQLIRVNDLPEMNHYAVAMNDPEGNEFDVV